MSLLKNLSKHLKAFLVTKFFAYSQEAFFKFLINIYFWRITNDISFLILYNIIFEFAHTLTYFPSWKISKEYNRFFPLRIGLVLQFVFLGLILFLKEDIIQYIIPVALIGGIAHGAYWSSDNLLKFDLTNPKNRLKFTAIHHILKQIAYSLVPLIASLLVINNWNIVSSYAEIFTASMIFTFLALISTFFISKQNSFVKNKYSPIKTWTALLKDKNIRTAFISTFLSYIADILPLLLGLVLFFSSGTELSIGSYQFITVLMAVIVNYLVGKYYSQKDYKKLLIYWGLINFALIFILLIKQDFISILIYGILSSIFSVANNPFYPLIQDSLSMYAKNKKHLLDIRVEFMTLIEISVMLGKISGLLFLLIIHFNLGFNTIAITAIIFAFAKLLSNFYVTKIKGDKFITIDSIN